MKKRIEKMIERTRIWSGYFAIILGVILAFAILRTAIFGSVEPEKHIWVEISLLLLIAVVAERLVQQWKQPFVMILLLLGVVISPHTLTAAWPTIAQMLQPILQPYGFHPNPQQLPHLVSENELIKTFASLGAIILLFRIGLHSELEKVFNLRNLLIALGGVVVPFVVGFMYAQFFGNNFASSLFIGAALTATSVGITVAVLDEMGLLQKQFSQAILGAAVIDDILALMVLALVRNLPQEISMQALMPFLQILAIAVVFVVSGLSLGRLFTMHFFSYKEEPQLSKRTLSGMLAILFFYAFAAESLGLSAIVGAFLAGLVLSYSPLAPLLNRSLFPLDVLFTPIFFISLGMLVDIWSIPAIFLPVLILTIIAIATKLIGCGAVAKAFGMDMRQSILVGFGMVPRGEIALIIGLLGLSAVDASGQPILTAAQYTLIASMAFLTTAIVPAGLKMLIEWARVEGERQKIS
jgi:Kef-type K+ transport system membrane component KefB